MTGEGMPGLRDRPTDRLTDPQGGILKFYTKQKRSPPSLGDRQAGSQSDKSRARNYMCTRKHACTQAGRQVELPCRLSSQPSGDPKHFHLPLPPNLFVFTKSGRCAIRTPQILAI